MPDRFNLTGVPHEIATDLRLYAQWRSWTLAETISYFVVFHRTGAPSEWRAAERWLAETHQRKELAP